MAVEERVLPIISERHQCPQTVSLVEVVEDLKADRERMRKAVNFHRDSAEELRAQIRSMTAREHSANNVSDISAKR